MTHHASHHRLAGAAIAALLASSATTAFAQDATVATSAPPPTIVLPDPAPVAVPSPVITAPVAAPEATVATPEPTVSSTPRATTRTAAPVRTAPRTVAAPVAAPAAQPAAAAPPVEPVAPPPADTPPVAPVAEAAPATAPAPVDEGGDNTLALAGLLGIVALGGAGIYAATRRRRAVYDEPVAYESSYEPTATVASPPARLSEPGAVPLARQPEPLLLGTPAMVAEPAARCDPEPEIRRPAAASFAMAEAVPSDPDARRDLLERMVDAPPSDENPFTSRKARLRRARLILQHREATGTEAPSLRTTLDRTQPFGTRTLVDA